MIWTPVVKGFATLNEMKTLYSLDDVIDMHEVIAEMLIAEKEAQSKD